jgi:hypothetical protein
VSVCMLRGTVTFSSGRTMCKVLRARGPAIGANHMFGIHMKRKQQTLPAGMSINDYVEGRVAMMSKCSVCGANMASMTQDQKAQHLQLHQQQLNLRGPKGASRLGL